MKTFIRGLKGLTILLAVMAIIIAIGASIIWGFINAPYLTGFILLLLFIYIIGLVNDGPSPSAP